jgi:hypothetical protein
MAGGHGLAGPFTWEVNKAWGSEMPKLPSVRATYKVVIAAMEMASRERGFGAAMLEAGKTKGVGPREVWLSTRIAMSFIAQGYDVKAEYSDGRNGRIDVAVFDGERILGCAIEVKVYFTHQKTQDGRHQYLSNTEKDFEKRAHLGVAQQAIVFVMNHQSMPHAGDGLYGAATIRRSLARIGSVGFKQFATDLGRRFGAENEIVPSTKSTRLTNVWSARRRGALSVLAVWVIGKMQ